MTKIKEGHLLERIKNKYKVVGEMKIKKLRSSPSKA